MGKNLQKNVAKKFEYAGLTKYAQQIRAAKNSDDLSKITCSCTKRLMRTNTSGFGEDLSHLLNKGEKNNVN